MPAPFSAHEPMHLLTELPGYQAVKSRFCAAAWSPRSDNEGRKPNSYRPGPASPRRTSRSVEKTCGQSSDRGRIRQRLGILDATFEGEICHSGFRCHGVDSTSRPNIRWSERTPTPESTAVTRGLIGFKQQSGVIRNVLDPTTVAAAVFFNAADPRFASRRRTDRRTLPPSHVNIKTLVTTRRSRSCRPRLGPTLAIVSTGQGRRVSLSLSIAADS